MTPHHVHAQAQSTCTYRCIGDCTSPLQRKLSRPSERDPNGSGTERAREQSRESGKMHAARLVSWIKRSLPRIWVIERKVGHEPSIARQASKTTFNPNVMQPRIHHFLKLGSLRFLFFPSSSRLSFSSLRFTSASFFTLVFLYFQHKFVQTEHSPRTSQQDHFKTSE